MNNIKKKERNWKYFKPKTPKDDILKFVNIKNPEKVSTRLKKAYELQIEAYQKIHEDFPFVRFYDFHKQVKKYVTKWYNDEYYFNENYQRSHFLPDGYFIKYTDCCSDLEIFLIEVENQSRLTDNKLQLIINWWMNSIDPNGYAPLYVLEFNRFGGFQRVVLNEGQDNGFELLKSYMSCEIRNCLT